MAPVMTSAPGALATPLIPAGPEELHREKLRWMRNGHPGALPSNVEWLRQLPEEERNRLGPRVLRKPSRTLSGVSIVAVMTAPARCPHGRCTYCPGGVENRSPQSYTGEEPSALRGAQFDYDARAITKHRLATLEGMGHPTSKIEVIVMGGTFPSRPKVYRDTIFKGIFDGLNDMRSASLEEAQRVNETSAHRCVSLTVETRPDWCDGRVLPDLMVAGVTRVEVGVECLRDEVLLAVGRAHGTREVIDATREARDRGLKVCYHLMLGLPGMNPERDFEDFRRIFDDPSFRPDMIKIYPTLVLPDTPLFDDWTTGKYVPYDLTTAADLLAREKSIVPPWVRIQRIQRDIPARLIAAGVRTSNVREKALELLKSRGLRCRCLRCREAGRHARPAADSFLFTEEWYEASGGKERFLSWLEPNSDTLAGYLRLRFPSSSTLGGLDAPVIRELKVLGTEVPVGATAGQVTDYQHRGFGRSLVEHAELIAEQEGFDRIYVTSAVGTREYYRRLGYTPAGVHMAKSLFSRRNS